MVAAVFHRFERAERQHGDDTIPAIGIIPATRIIVALFVTIRRAPR
jgi:hypothetical protein